MPRKSPFSIVLSAEEREILEQRARRYTLPYRDVQRAKLILLAAEGLENKEIAERLDLPRPKVFPRDPGFAAKAGRVLDLYARIWEGEALAPAEYVLCADEKTQIQIRERRHPLVPPGPGQPQRVEHEYRRHGTCAYLAAWDVHHGRLFGEVVDRCANAAFDAFVAQVMETEPYASAGRVFWVVDNGTVHRGQRACDRLAARWPNLVLVHLPVHASWLNQIEIYFSILQRKALTPDHFEHRQTVADRILGFQAHYESIAQPFEWKFTRQDLADLLAKCPSATEIPIAA